MIKMISKDAVCSISQGFYAVIKAFELGDEGCFSLAQNNNIYTQTLYCSMSDHDKKKWISQKIRVSFNFCKVSMLSSMHLFVNSAMKGCFSLTRIANITDIQLCSISDHDQKNGFHKRYSIIQFSKVSMLLSSKAFVNSAIKGVSRTHF
jgi:hypothetical protein